ncbi:unnamed protein product [Fraxinus pennsylvanica]|uniref:Uncharacterized protein n=1 Tax=Fraxinus pennsylvanica TaxID=56036 RepID=A0AAD2AHF5_9LAMI|nr:unnamed protein product [Fraxinus pennsylvanica]
MGYIGSFFWKGYFRNEEDARKNDIFDLINTSITLASIENPNEFRSRRMQIIESLFDSDSQAPAKPKKRSNHNARPTSKNQERIVIHGCKDQACQDEIAAEECFDEFANQLEKELDDDAQPAEESLEEFANQLEKELDDHAQPIGLCNVHLRDKKPDKKRKAEVLDVKEIVPPPRLCRDGKPKRGFGRLDVVSPRISFSYDLREADFVPVDSHNPQSDLDFIDFDFSIGDHFSLELSSADELFANGKILPVEVKKFEPSKEIYRSKPTEPSPSTRTRRFVQNTNEDTITKKKTLIEFLSNTCDAEEKPPT